MNVARGGLKKNRGGGGGGGKKKKNIYGEVINFSQITTIVLALHEKHAKKYLRIKV